MATIVATIVQRALCYWKSTKR